MNIRSVVSIPKVHLYSLLPKIKNNPQESSSVVDFPSPFPLFLPSSLHECWWNPSFQCGVLQAPRRQLNGISTPLSGTCYRRETPLNGVHLIKKEVGHFPVVFTECVVGRRESTFWGFSPAAAQQNGYRVICQNGCT